MKPFTQHDESVRSAGMTWLTEHDEAEVELPRERRVHKRKV